MTGEALFDTSIFPLKPTDKTGFALETLLDLKVSAIPVVDDGVVAGFFEGHQAIGKQARTPVRDLMSSRPGWVMSNQHPMNGYLRRMAELSADCIAITDERDRYLGTITPGSLVRNMGSSYSQKEQGSLICLEMPSRNYSLSELSRLAEAVDVKIIGVTIFSIPDSAHIEVVLKLNTQFAEKVSAGFSRFGYQVTAVYYSHPDETDLRERYESLIKYLEL